MIDNALNYKGFEPYLVLRLTSFIDNSYVFCFGSDCYIRVEAHEYIEGSDLNDKWEVTQVKTDGINILHVSNDYKNLFDHEVLEELTRLRDADDARIVKNHISKVSKRADGSYHYIFTFHNGFGASVIREEPIFGEPINELSVVRVLDSHNGDFVPVFKTSVAKESLYSLSDKKVREWLLIMAGMQYEDFYRDYDPKKDFRTMKEDCIKRARERIAEQRHKEKILMEEEEIWK